MSTHEKYEVRKFEKMVAGLLPTTEELMENLAVEEVIGEGDVTFDEQ